MSTPVSEPVCETAAELWADDELSDEAIDRHAAQQRGKATCACPVCPPCRGGRP